MPKKKEIARVGPREGYDLWSETYDSTPNPVVAMDSRHTIARLGPARGELILDAGCGTGRNLRQLLHAGSAPVGIDFSAGMLGVAKRNYPQVPLALADLEQPLPFISATFDAVLCALIGEHLNKLSAVLSEFHRIIKVGGRLVFSVYHPAMSAAGIEANFERKGVEYRLGAVHYSVDEHIETLKQQGFVDVTAAEFRGDKELARQVPSGAKYFDSPVLLILSATRP